MTFTSRYNRFVVTGRHTIPGIGPRSYLKYKWAALHRFIVDVDGHLHRVCNLARGNSDFDAVVAVSQVLNTGGTAGALYQGHEGVSASRLRHGKVIEGSQVKSVLLAVHEGGHEGCGIQGAQKQRDGGSNSDRIDLISTSGVWVVAR